MTAVQYGFLAAMTLVSMAIVGFVAVVVAGARSADGGEYPTLGLLLRLARPSADRVEGNRWAFYAHRVSGFAIFAFLALHVLDVALYALSPAAFDEVHVLYGTAPMRVFECGLLFALLFHALNGLRLVAIDLWDLGVAAATRLLGLVALATAATGAAGSAVILAPLVSGAP